MYFKMLAFACSFLFPFTFSMENLYRFEIQPYVKTFKNQQTRSCTQLDPFILQCDGVESLKTILWEKYNQYVQKEAIVRETAEGITYQLKEEAAEESDISKFLYFFHNNRQCMLDSSLTENKLATFSRTSESVFLFILKYSTSILDRNMFMQLSMKVLNPRSQDRSGSASEEIHQEMIQELKEIHADHYVSEEINWRLWANHILRLPVPQQSNAKLEPPPGPIIHLFAHSPRNSDLRLNQIKESFSGAMAMIKSLENHLKDINSSREILKMDLVDLGNRVSLLEQCISTYKTVLQALESAFEPRETTSPDIFPNIEDVDH
jgi:hypothetical protein